MEKVAWLAALALSALALPSLDYLYPLLAPASEAGGCEAVVYDAVGVVDWDPGPGVCVERELGVWDLRGPLGGDARLVVIVTHSLPGGYLATTMDVGDARLMLHPLSVAAGWLVKGDVPGGEVVAVSSSALSHGRGLEGKFIVLVACNLPGLESVASALLSRGASGVAYPLEASLTVQEAEMIVRGVLAWGVDWLCGSGMARCVQQAG